MIKLLTLALLLSTLVSARENPFFPPAGQKDLLSTTNKDLSAQPLKRAAISLPSSARTIQKVTVEFKNLDGSLQTRSIKLDNSVDWHLPIFISQSIGKIQEKEVEEKNIVYEKLFSSKYISFSKDNKKLKINTKDKMIRSFLLAKPYRLVLDFKRDVSLKSQSRSFESKVFKKISLGTHRGYYRAVVLLDGQYRFKKFKENYGYRIKLY